MAITPEIQPTIATQKATTGCQAVANEITAEDPEITASVLAVVSFWRIILVTVNKWFLC